MTLNVEIPDHLAERLAPAGDDLSRRALEAFALEEYKAGLMKQKDRFARAFSVKMLTYALGRPVSYTDRNVVDILTDALKKNDDRIQPLVYAIVASEPFNTK